MKRRILRRLVYTALLLFIVAATAVALCAGTPFGSRWLIQRAVAASGQPLTIGHIEGTLLEGLSLTDIRYRSEPVNVSAAALALRWRPIGLLAGELTLSAVDGRRINIDLPAGEAPVDAGASGGFSLPALPLGFAVNQSEITDITIDRDGEAFHIEALELAGAINNNGISIKRLSVKHADFGVSTRARLVARPPHAVQAEVQWYTGDDERRSAAGEATLKGTLDTMDFTHRLSQPLTVHSTGKLKALLQKPVVNAESTLPAQSLASVGLDGWTLKESRVHTEGWIDGYRWNADFGVDAEQWPQNRGSAEGQGTLSGLVFEQFTVQSLNGELTGSGELAWTPRLEWQTRIKAEGVDPGAIDSRWPGAISFHTHNSGFYDYESGRYAVKTRDLSLSGRLQTRRIAASGGLDISSEALAAHAFNLSLGANRLSLNGSLANGAGREVDLAWNLDLADLSAIPLPGQTPMAGRASGRGRVAGSLQDPRINARLDAADLDYETLSAGSVELNATHSAANGHDIRLTAADLTFDTYKASAAGLTIQGRPADHSIQLNARSEPLDITLAFEDGALKLQPDRPWQWQSTIQQFDLRIARAGDWRLARGARLNASPTRLSIGKNCLKQDGARLCTTADWHRPEGFDIKGQIEQLPMTLLHPWIAANSRLEGQVNGEFTVTGTGPSLRSRVQLASPAGRFIIAGEDEEADIYAWRRLGAEFSHDNEATQGRVDFDLAQLGRIHGDVTMTADERLQGELQASIDDIGWLELLLPRLRELTGALQADISVAGTRGQPRIAGRATLADAGTEIPALGIAITDMRATVDGDNNAFDIESTATSGPGKLTTEGTFKLKPDLQYQLDMQLTGETFEIVDLRRADVQISPDVRLRLTPSTVEATGVVKVPVTHISLKTMPASAVNVSPDAQIAGQAGPAANGRRAVNANLKLVLGEEVHFDGLGLQARLTGELDLTETPGQPPLAYGELEVVEGRYKAYGQKLQLDGGRLIFRGPYDNPTLNVRAVRETPDATVGLHLTGTLKQPRSRVFSEPPLPDSEATALLLTGRSLSSASESDANMLINAVAALGVKGGEGITQQIAQTFNLDEIKIQAGGGFEEGSLLLGKHLSPRLYIQYVVGFLNQAGQLNLEYRLTENLKLEARSGEERSMDLMYKIER